MKHERRAVLDVARWEFMRFAKPKQLITGAVITMVIVAAAMLAGRAAGGESRTRDVAVIGADLLPLTEAAGPTRLRFTRHDTGELDGLLEQVRDRDLDGVLMIRSTDVAELHVRSAAAWTGEVQALLAMARQQLMVREAGLDPGTLAGILAPPALEVVVERGSASSTLPMIIVIGLMLMAVFTGMAYVFTSITGEKQIRVTEQVLSAIPAQAWMDGKILGLVAISMLSVVTQVLAFAGAFVIVGLMTDGVSFPIPTTMGDPLVVAIIILFGLVGLVFWFAFLALVATIIDDPHSSTRGSWIMLPLLGTAAAFYILADAGSTAARVLSMVPLTSVSAMPARMVAGEAPGLEVAISLALLVASAWLLRIAAGRVLRVGMLMYGKEPSWSEVRRWAMQPAE